MPKDISGTVPQSKSQKNKGKRKGKLKPQHGGICSKCGQTSNSATPGSIHATCGEPTKDIALLYGLRASVLRRYLTSDGQGKWLSQSEHEQYKADIKAYLLKLRNFNTSTNRWENGLGQPICFLTREVIDPVLLEALEETVNMKVSVQTDTADAESESTEQKAA